MQESRWKWSAIQNHIHTSLPQQHDLKVVQVAHGRWMFDRKHLGIADGTGEDFLAANEIDDSAIGGTSTDHNRKLQRLADVDERTRRLALWKRLPGSDSPRRSGPALLRELGIYGGAQGIWVDKARTAAMSADSAGITVGLLHTGSSYADDLSDDFLLYHYPSTNRPAARDAAEVDATKNAKRIGVPVFVITYPTRGSKFRDVRLGWIENWDDEAKLFLISFGEVLPSDGQDRIDEQPFSLITERMRATQIVAARPSQQRFRFNVFKRYGARCAFCGIAVSELLDAAHLCSVRDSGTDDPRNGLPLCILHHRAMDVGFVRIDPVTLELHPRIQGPALAELNVSFASLNHLSSRPHTEALQWIWNRWTTTTAFGDENAPLIE